MTYLFYGIIIFTHYSLNALYGHLDNNWYPQKKSALRSSLHSLHIKAQKKYPDTFINKSSVRACIVPHASMHYSGITACAAYQHLDPSTERIIIIAPNHSGEKSLLYAPSASQYVIPTGSLVIDTKIVQSLISRKICSYNDAIFNNEHSCEIQLPFIQFYCPKAKIIPLIIGEVSCQQARMIAEALKKHISKKTVVIISSDFVHYGKNYNFIPFSNHQLLRTRALNSKAIQYIEAKDCKGFNNFMYETHASICGVSPLKIFLQLCDIDAFGSLQSWLVAYNTSTRSDTDDFVSYIGIVFTSELQKNNPLSELLLTAQEKEGLLEQAYNTLNHMFDTSYDEALYYPLLSAGMYKKQGAFTTLYGPNKILRGCVGRIESNEPLYKLIPTVTKDAAQKDSRFSPLKKNMIQDTKIHLSILSNPKKINSYKEITIGKDGVILELDNTSAIFLPEVALEQKWTKEELLNNLSQKAGLAKDAWFSKQTVFKTFNTVLIF